MVPTMNAKLSRSFPLEILKTQMFLKMGNVQNLLLDIRLVYFYHMIYNIISCFYPQKMEYHLFVQRLSIKRLCEPHAKWVRLGYDKHQKMFTPTFAFHVHVRMLLYIYIYMYILRACMYIHICTYTDISTCQSTQKYMIYKVIFNRRKFRN